MHLINVRAKIFEDCTRPIKFKETTGDNYYLRITLTPPERGYVLTEIKLANSSGLMSAVKSDPGGLTIDSLRNGVYSDGVVPSLSPNDGFSDLTAPTIVADSPVADANEIFLKKTSQFFQSLDLGGDGATQSVGAYAVLVWKHPITEETIEINVNQGPFIIEEVSREVTPTIINENPSIKLKRTLCKYAQHDDLYKMLDDPFNATKSSSPLYTMQENFVDLYATAEFLPQDIFIKYLRRPALMSYIRGIGSELPEHTHDEVVEMAVKSILEAFESPRYQSQSGEVLESE